MRILRQQIGQNMRVEFITGNCAARQEAQNHISRVYHDVYGASLTSFAPLLVTARNVHGEIVCAAGVRTAKDGFFSDTYLGSDFGKALIGPDNTTVPLTQVMEVVSLASTTPFPVLPMLDTVISWGRTQGMTCGVFTATAPLRRLLQRTGLAYIALCPADKVQVADPKSWGRYYDQDPWVCACTDDVFTPISLSPRSQRVSTPLRSEAC